MDEWRRGLDLTVSREDIGSALSSLTRYRFQKLKRKAISAKAPMIEKSTLKHAGRPSAKTDFVHLGQIFVEDENVHRFPFSHNVN